MSEVVTDEDTKMPVRRGQFKLNVDLSNISMKPFTLTTDSKKKKEKIFVKGDPDKFPTKLSNDSRRKSVGQMLEESINFDELNYENKQLEEEEDLDLVAAKGATDSRTRSAVIDFQKKSEEQKKDNKVNSAFSFGRNPFAFGGDSQNVQAVTTTTTFKFGSSTANFNPFAPKKIDEKKEEESV